MSAADAKGGVKGKSQVKRGSADVAGLGGTAADAARVVLIGGGESLPNKVIGSRLSCSVKPAPGDSGVFVVQAIG